MFNKYVAAKFTGESTAKKLKIGRELTDLVYRHEFFFVCVFLEHGVVVLHMQLVVVVTFLS